MQRKHRRWQVTFVMTDTPSKGTGEVFLTQAEAKKVIEGIMFNDLPEGIGIDKVKVEGGW